MMPSWPGGSTPLVSTPVVSVVSGNCRAPVTVTWPVGAAGTAPERSAAADASPGSQPRTTGRAAPSASRSGVST